jgi:hypothetical protein
MTTIISNLLTRKRKLIEQLESAMGDEREHIERSPLHPRLSFRLPTALRAVSSAVMVRRTSRAGDEFNPATGE